MESLKGINVVDLSQGPAAAFATMFLADQGARVIRVLDRNDDPARGGGFVIWDRGKECLRVDLASELNQNASTLDGLLRESDIVVEDFAPSSKYQALVDTERLAEAYPWLISCSITAYGKVGPLKDEPPIDDLILARMGILGGMPGFRPPPVHVVHPLPSVGAALFANLGITASLLAREETGRGRAVSTSLMAGALLYHPKVIGEHIERHVFQTHPAGSAPFYSVYECADGNWIQLGCVHIGFITIAANVMGIGEFVAAERFNGGRGGVSDDADEELRAKLRDVMRERPADTWAREFEEADVPFAPARLTPEGMSDPQVMHNAMVVTLDDPALGEVTQMGVPIHLSETPGRVAGPRQLESTVAIEIPNDFKRTPTDVPPTPRTEPDPAPLSGVRVLEITNLIAGPTGGRLLADLGADVIKFEPPGGDLSRPIGRTYFYNVNFNKRSVCVDTRDDRGKVVAQRIAASADALLANLRPHATERMGIGPTVNPTLIETHLTGYGWTGPYSKRPGIDPLAQALMGLERAQGGPDNPPVFPAQLAPTDYTTGAMGALGTILALFARKRGGVVQRVDSNLLNGAVVLSSAWFAKYAGQPIRPLADRDQYGLNPFHRLFRLRDGWIYVAADDAQQKTALCEFVGVAEPDDADETSHPNETSFATELAATFSNRSVHDTLSTLKSKGIACAEAQAGDSELFLDDPHAQANDMVAIRQHPTAGEIQVAWQYVQFSGTRPTAGRPTPLLGEHTHEVLDEVGYRADEIKGLFDDAIVKAERP
ncbi:MAG: CoA transferase [Pseudomonadota bacterium]